MHNLTTNFFLKGKGRSEAGKCAQFDNQHRLDANCNFSKKDSAKSSPRVVSTTMMKRIMEIKSTNFLVVRR